MTENLKQKTVNGILWSSIERFSGQGVSFVLGLVIARLLSPSDYGILAMLAIFIAISQTFVDSGFSTALVRKIDRTEADNSTVFYFNIAVGVVAYGILFFTAPLIANFYDTPLLTKITRVVATTLIINSFCVVQQALLTSKIDFKTQAQISLISAIVSGLVGIALAYYGFGVWALVAQAVSASILRMALLWILSTWKPKAPFSTQSFKESFSYGSKLLASGLLDTIYNNVYTIVIGKLFSAASLGLYSRANQFAQFPSSNITGIIQRVTFPVLCVMQNEDERLRGNYRKIIRMSGFIVFPLMIGLAVVAQPLIELLLTEKWIGAVIFLQIICFSMMWYPIHAINLNLLQVKGRSDLFLRLEVIKKIIGITVLCITIPMGLIAMCYGTIATSLICLIVNTYYTRKLIQVGFIKQMRDLTPSLIKSLIMGALVWASMLLFDSSVAKLSIGLLVGGASYLIMSIATTAQEWLFVKEIILKK
ncbi:MAG: lipopolysaccharide biosynthesis protein [Muribaculaceae bacterium]